MLASYWVFLLIVGSVGVLSLVVAARFAAYQRYEGKRAVTCPGSKSEANVEVDAGHAFMTALRGREEVRLKSCSRWPEHQDCGQECVAEIAQVPESVMRLVRRWYRGEGCATCGSPLAEADWESERIALLDAALNLVEVRDLPTEGLPLSLRNYRAICGKCHEKEKTAARTRRVFLN